MSAQQSPSDNRSQSPSFATPTRSSNAKRKNPSGKVRSEHTGLTRSVEDSTLKDNIETTQKEVDEAMQEAEETAEEWVSKQFQTPLSTPAPHPNPPSTPVPITPILTPAILNLNPNNNNVPTEEGPTRESLQKQRKLPDAHERCVHIGKLGQCRNKITPFSKTQHCGTHDFIAANKDKIEMKQKMKKISVFVDKRLARKEKLEREIKDNIRFAQQADADRVRLQKREEFNKSNIDSAYEKLLAVASS